MEGAWNIMTMYQDSKRIVLDTSATYTGDYSTQTGWTSNNSRISITGGYAYMNNSGSSYGDYIYTPLGLTLSDTAWVADFEGRSTSGTFRSMPITPRKGNGGRREAQDCE